jgi:hypothetical protein
MQKPVSNISVDVDERRKTTLIHNDVRRQDIGQLFIMSFTNIESPMFVVHFYGLVCFVCLQFYGV